jgi:SAM-dependent methyltransferase
MLQDGSAFQGTYWLAHPRVHGHYQEGATGGRTDRFPRWFDYCLGAYLPDLPVERMVEFGCGTGDLALELAARGACRSLDAFDFAEDAVRIASGKARERGVAGVSFQRVDCNRWRASEIRYDAAWFNMSLHHVEALEHLCAQTARALRPGAYLFVNEYVGPNRFAFTPRQKAVLAALSECIPLRYRRLPPGRLLGPSHRTAPPIPNPRAVRRADPSEAVRSADIMKVLARHFEIVAVNPIGGTLLQFLLNDIAQNFTPDDPVAVRLLEVLIEMESVLIAAGDLQSDFALIIARR